MSVIKPYNAEGSKKSQVTQMFNRVAHSYDLLNHSLSLGIDRGWRVSLVKQAAAAKPRQVLDVATGTGDLAIMLSRAIPEAAVRGVDISEQMLKVAERKVAQAELDKRIFLQVCDAEQLPLKDESMDLVTCAFGVRNFENLKAGLGEMLRVLRPGGCVMILEFSVPANPIFRAVYSFYFRRILPWVGGIISGDRKAYSYLPKSVEGSVYGQAMVDVLCEVGFENVTIKPLMNGVSTLYIGKKK